MITDELLSPQVLVLAPELRVREALDIFSRARLSQLPLVEENQYLGLVEEASLMEADPGLSLKDQGGEDWSRPFLTTQSHPFEAFRMVHERDLMVLPVLDWEQQYRGSITLRELLRYAAENSGWDVPGGIVVFMVSTVDYSLSRIAQICEEESLTIMGVQVRPHARGGWVEVTLKLNREDLDGLTQALERHGYRLLEVYGDQPRKEEVMDRYQLLMNYINM